MKIKVHLTAFGDVDKEAKIRVVTLPADKVYKTVEDVLNDVFHYGQNDFQSVEGCYSVSVGDIIELSDGELHMVNDFGFIKKGEHPKKVGTGIYCKLRYRGKIHPPHPLMIEHFEYLVEVESEIDKAIREHTDK